MNFFKSFARAIILRLYISNFNMSNYAAPSWSNTDKIGYTFLE